jgi:vacuolar-type H+-ATPase subunit H
MNELLNPNNRNKVITDSNVGETEVVQKIAKAKATADKIVEAAREIPKRRKGEQYRVGE